MSLCEQCSSRSCGVSALRCIQAINTMIRLEILEALHKTLRSFSSRECEWTDVWWSLGCNDLHLAAGVDCYHPNEYCRRRYACCRYGVST